MERYGYMYTTEELNSAFTTKCKHISRMNSSFYVNLKDCIRDALICDSLREGEKRYYIKLLKTSDVVHHIEDTSNNYIYGYVYLFVKNDENDKQISLYEGMCSLYDNMLDCVADKKTFKECELTKSGEYKIKVSYYIILNNENIIKELNRLYV